MMCQKKLALKLTSMNVQGFLNAAVDRPMYRGQSVEKLFSKNCETKKKYGLKLEISPSCHWRPREIPADVYRNDVEPFKRSFCIIHPSFPGRVSVIEENGEQLGLWSI